MQRLLVSLLGWACVPAVSAAVATPGKAFDRFITIWLENQVTSHF
jgi:hypothetical protein